MDPSKSPPYRKKRSALEEVKNPAIKRPSTSTEQKSTKRRRTHRSPTPPPAEDTNSTTQKPPAIIRMRSHASVIESGDVVLVDDIEQRILAEARGVTRKNIPCGVFNSTYLSHFEHTDRRPNLDINAI